MKGNQKPTMEQRHALQTIDAGHGGGQVLRTALSLAALTGIAIDIRNIRQNRPKPGLQPQHLACVHAVATITGGTLEHDAIGASHVVFRPGSAHGGQYHFDIGTAGSCALLLQCVLPPLLFANAPSTVTIKGGTDVPFSPPALFMQRTFIPALEKMGAHVSVNVKRHGFYPAGGGILEAQIKPVKKLKRLDVTDAGSEKQKGKKPELHAIIVSSQLPGHVAVREKAALAKHMDGTNIEIRNVDAASPGNLVFLEATYGNGHETWTMGFDALGKIGKSAESVAQDAIDAFQRFDQSPDVIEPHLLDQLLLYEALAYGKSGEDGTSGLQVGQLSDHAQSNLRIIHELLGTDHTFSESVLSIQHQKR